MATAIRALAATFALAFAIAVVAGEARASFPGANGKIVFQTNRDGNAWHADASSRMTTSASIAARSPAPRGGTTTRPTGRRCADWQPHGQRETIGT
jgi:hypothetical protein